MAGAGGRHPAARVRARWCCGDRLGSPKLRRTRFQDASSILFSDEQNVFEETVAYALPEGSRTVVDRDPDATPNGTDRYDREHVHFTPHPGQRDALSHFLNSEFAPLAAASDDVVKVRIHAPEPA